MLSYRYVTHTPNTSFPPKFLKHVPQILNAGITHYLVLALIEISEEDFCKIGAAQPNKSGVTVSLSLAVAVLSNLQQLAGFPKPGVSLFPLP